MKYLQHYLDLSVQFGISYGVKIIFALLIFVIGRRLAKWLTNFVIKAMQKRSVDVELTGFVESLLFYGLMALVLISALGQLGVQTASFIAILGAASLAIGLALQGSLSNFAAGILILILRPFSVDEWVDVAGESGKVSKIRIFTTELLTGDNKCVIIPNARVLDSNIVNYSSTGVRRVDLKFGISYDDDIDLAKSVIKQVLAADPNVLQQIEATVAVATLADSSVDFVVRPWAKSDHYWDVYFNVTEQIKKQFDANNISIPYPQRVFHNPHEQTS